MPVYPWTDRKFAYKRTLADVTTLIARLNGAPARLDDSLRSIEERYMRVRPPGKVKEGEFRPPLLWSPLDHAGHLLDIDELHSQRVKDYLNDAETFSAADPTNSKTDNEHYNRQPLDPILQRFRIGRSTMANVLFGLTESAFEKKSKHPRTGETLRLLDYIENIAEHDDHHLAVIRELIWNPGAPS